jgi:hypothetical protein
VPYSDFGWFFGSPLFQTAHELRWFRYCHLENPQCPLGFLWGDIKMNQKEEDRQRAIIMLVIITAIFFAFVMLFISIILRDMRDQTYMLCCEQVGGSIMVDGLDCQLGGCAYCSVPIEELLKKTACGVQG